MNRKALFRPLLFILLSSQVFVSMPAELTKQLEELTKMSNELITISSIAYEFEKELIKLQKEYDALKKENDKLTKQSKSKAVTEKQADKELIAQNTQLSQELEKAKADREKAIADLELETQKLTESNAKITELERVNKELKAQVESPAASQAEVPAEPAETEKPKEKVKESKQVIEFRAQLAAISSEKDFDQKLKLYQDLKRQLMTNTEDTDYIHQVAPLLFKQVMAENVNAPTFMNMVKNDITKIKKQIQTLAQFITFIENLDEIPALKPEEPDSLKTYKAKVQTGIDALQKYADQHGAAVKEPKKKEVEHLAPAQLKAKAFTLDSFNKELETLDTIEDFVKKIQYLKQLRNVLNSAVDKEKNPIIANDDLLSAGNELFNAMQGLYNELNVKEPLTKKQMPYDEYKKKLQALDTFLLESFQNKSAKEKTGTIIQYIDRVSGNKELTDGLAAMADETKKKLDAM